MSGRGLVGGAFAAAAPRDAAQQPAQPGAVLTAEAREQKLTRPQRPTSR
jgi:hypothetical protein